MGDAIIGYRDQGGTPRAAAFTTVQTIVQAGDTIVNTAAQTAFATKGTILANTLFAGQVIRFTSGGEYGTANIPTSRQFANLFFSIGGNLMLGVGSKTPNGINMTTASWSVVGMIICTATGASGAVEGDAIWTFQDQSLAGSNDQVWCNSTNTPFVFDSTIDNDIQLGATWFAAAPANYITMRHLTVEVSV